MKQDPFLKQGSNYYMTMLPTLAACDKHASLLLSENETRIKFLINLASSVEVQTTAGRMYFFIDLKIKFGTPEDFFAIIFSL
jgi:hypothetical protein